MKQILFIILSLFSLAISAEEKQYDFVVAQDGSGDFRTVQEAINAVPDFRKAKETRIFIKNGTYKEKLVLAECKINVTLIGESVEGTILTYDDYASKPNLFGENKGTSGSSSFYMYGNDFHASNITFENSSGPVGQAVAMFVAGNRTVFTNCRFKGYQDTLYTYGKQSKQLYRDCYIEGTVDFIFGASTCFFENCEIHSIGRGYLTAASTTQGTPFGYVFENCRLTAEPDIEKVELGRPWRPYAQTVYVNCTMGKHIAPEGWFNWGVEKEKTAFYGECGSKDETGNLIDISKRVAWSHQVNAADYTIDKVLADADKPDWYKAPDTLTERHPEYLPGLTIGQTAPDFTAPDTLGHKLSLSNYRGQYVVVDFWASWCGDCRREIPFLKQLYNDTKDKQVNGKPLQWIGLSFDMKKDQWLSMLRKEQFPWPQVSNLKSTRQDPTFKNFQLHWIPAFYIIDPDGKVVGRAITADGLRKEINKILK